MDCRDLALRLHSAQATLLQTTGTNSKSWVLAIHPDDWMSVIASVPGDHWIEYNWTRARVGVTFRGVTVEQSSKVQPDQPRLRVEVAV